jgi:CheY-like chemotaxis protein
MTMASILIIDDSMFMRKKLSSVLQTVKHDIFEAEDGIKGLQAASNRKFDLVLLDIIMPGTDGIKILKMMREQFPGTPVIIVTADIQESVHKQCIEIGASAVVHKPPREGELLAAVAEAIGKAGGAA